ncbi:hypothetical protein [Kineococcus terrestris]|uniref:hypothetical protein n=1 Tax=Kineococcus terrestris TaxID=2044856 RepID=UPI0034DABF9C
MTTPQPPGDPADRPEPVSPGPLDGVVVPGLPGDLGPADRALRDLRAPLVAWFDEWTGEDPEVDGEAVVEVFAGTLDDLLELRGGEPTATAFTPADLELLLGRVVPAQVAASGTEDPQGVTDDLRAVWSAYLLFLEETGRWTGTPEDLAACREALHPAEPDVAEVLAAAAADVDAQQEDAVVLTSFPVRAARAVLERVGDRLAVPEDEELALPDVEALLAALDVRPAEAPAALEDVPWLQQVVVTMIDLELLDGDDETELRPGPQAPTWLDPDEEARAVRRALVGRFVVHDPDVLGGGFSVAEALVPTVLAAAATGTPFSSRTLDRLVDRAGPLGAAAGAALEQLVDRLGDLRAFGLVSEEPWTVEPGLWPALAAATAEEDEEAPGPLGDLFAGPDVEQLFDAVAGSLGLSEEQKRQVRGALGG